ILVEQDVAIVGTVCKIINRKNTARMPPLQAFPSRIQCIVIDNEPIDIAELANRFRRLRRIPLPGCRQPMSVRSTRRIDQLLIPFGSRQEQKAMTIRLDQATEPGSMLAHHKNDLGSVTGQFIPEAQAPRKMSHADFDGGVDPNYNLPYVAHRLA